MRKAYVSMIALVLGLAFVMAPMGAFACGSAKTGTTSANASTVNAKYAGADKACITSNKAACSAEKVSTSADAAETSAETKFASATFHVTGMHCGACENKVTTALKNTAGVDKVEKVDYKTGTAVVTYDAAVVGCTSNMTKAIDAAGFTAEVVPAVASDAVNNCPYSKACPHTGEACTNMTAAQKAACASKCPAMMGDKASATETKTETKTDGSL